jgi:hypothetical protein
MSSQKQCELLETCGFFLNFKSHTESIKQRWIELYCENSENSEICERKIIRKQTGEPPANNMAPTGKLL